MTNKNKLILTLRIKKVTWILSILICVLLVLSVLASAWHYYKHLTPFGASPLVQLFRLVDVANIPTFFATLIDLGCAAVLAVLAKLKKEQSDRFYRHWAFLSAIFFYIALDETASIHELSILPLRHALGAGGIFYYTWIVLAIPLAMAVVLSYLRLVKSLPRKHQILVFAAGAIYLGGSLAGEMISGYAVSRQFNYWRTINALFSTLEEFCELAGTSLFLCVLLDYLKEQGTTLEIRPE